MGAVPVSAPPAGAPRFDLPEIDAFTRPYWDAAAQGQLLIRRCTDCGQSHHYPREFCPRCWSENVVWERASGRATLYTWSVVHRNDLPPFGARVPYTAAVVELAEGLRMMTELVGHAGLDRSVDMDLRTDMDLRVGMDLRVDFRAAHEGAPAIPVFRPAS
ncbi:OB-fold domain-containing protein [Streptomyces milbemycinicus]